jgi:glutathione S-transferase
MKLYHSPASPYVRKVNVVAIHHGLTLDRVATNPHESPAELLRDNPLSKVPCLVTDDGVSLPDSPIICEYLDSIGTGEKLLPDHGAPALARPAGGGAGRRQSWTPPWRAAWPRSTRRTRRARRPTRATRRRSTEPWTRWKPRTTRRR